MDGISGIMFSYRPVASNVRRFTDGCAKRTFARLATLIASTNSVSRFCDHVNVLLARTSMREYGVTRTVFRSVPRKYAPSCASQ